MTGGAQHETHLATEDARAFVGRLPGHDVIFACCQQIDRHVECAKINALPAHVELARNAQAVVQIQVAHVPAGKRPRQVGRIGIPVKQIEGLRLLPFQVVAGDVVPDQVIGTQEREGALQIACRQQATLPDRRLTCSQTLFIDEQTDLAGIREIEQRRQQRQRGNGIFTARFQNSQRCCQDGATDTEAQGIDLLDPANLAHDAQGVNCAVFQIIIPGHIPLRFHRIAPGHQENRVALLDHEADQGVVRLQIHDVELVDARRHHQQGSRSDLGCERRVLDELHQLVFVNHGTFRGGDIAADLEHRLVGHRDTPFLEITDQVVDPVGNALPLGFQRQLDEFRIGRSKIRRRHGIGQLARHEAKPILGLFVFSRHDFDDLFQILGIEQVSLMQVIVNRAVSPLRRRKATVARFGKNLEFLFLPLLLGQHGLPQGHLLIHELFLKRGDGLWIDGG